MAHILMATDYSPAARHAAIYAGHLAQHLQLELKLFHAYVIPFSYTDSPVPLLNVEEVQGIAEQSMEAERLHLQKLFPGLKVSGDIVPGDIIDTITERIPDEKPALVAMGTSGAGGDSFLWGSMAVKALRNLTVPVLAIPLEAAWEPVQNVCFAADYKNIGDNFPYAELNNWVQLLGARLSIVHVDKPGETLAPETNFHELMAPSAPDYHTVIHEHVGEGINNYLERNKTDWLMVIPKKYGFFENLFHKSRTEMIAKASKVPILALHQD